MGEVGRGRGEGDCWVERVKGKKWVDWGEGPRDNTDEPPQRVVVDNRQRGSDMEQFEKEFQDRVTATLDALGVYARQAEIASESGKDAARLVTAFDQVIGLYSLAPEGPTYENLVAVRAELATQSGSDRTDGDALSAKVRAMLGAGIDLAPEINERAETLLSRWVASAPKGGKGSGSRSSGGGASTATPVEFRCSCGWVGHDKWGTNSARWSWLKHFAGSAHGVRDEAGRDGRVGKDHPLYAAVTNILDPVTKGNETRAAAKVEGVGELVAIVDPR